MAFPSKCEGRIISPVPFGESGTSTVVDPNILSEADQSPLPFGEPIVSNSFKFRKSLPPPASRLKPKPGLRRIDHFHHAGGTNWTNDNPSPLPFGELVTSTLGQIINLLHYERSPLPFGELVTSTN
jgi:hypothetical protein